MKQFDNMQQSDCPSGQGNKNVYATGTGSDMTSYKSIDWENDSRELTSGIQIFGHSIEFKSDGTLRCVQCENEVETPHIIKQSSPFREIVYRLYALNGFREIDCETEIMDNLLKQKKKNDDITPGIHDPGSPPHSIYRYGDQVINSPNGHKYKVFNDDNGETKFQNMDTGDVLDYDSYQHKIYNESMSIADSSKSNTSSSTSDDKTDSSLFEGVVNKLR